MRLANARTWRTVAALLACAACLAATVAATPAASAAAAARSCGSKEITVREAGESTMVPVSRIRVEGGATCKQAVTVIAGVLKKDLPKGWKVAKASFKVPNGLVAQEVVNGRKKVMFATVGPGAS